MEHDPKLNECGTPASCRPKLLTTDEAAMMVAVSVSLIYEWCHERRLPHFRLGGAGKRGKIVIDERELLAFLRTCRVEGSDPLDDDDLTHMR